MREVTTVAGPDSNLQNARPARSHRRTYAAIAAGAAVLGLAGALLGQDTSGTPQSGNQRSTGDGTPAYFVGEASNRWPTDTLRDWASYGDQLSVVTVLGDRELPPPTVGTTGGFVGREISLRIDRTVWRRPGAPEVNSTINVVVYGWIEIEGVRRRATTVGGVWPEVGRRYLAPLTRNAEGEWTFLSSTTPVTLDGDVATSRVAAGEPVEALRAVKGHGVAEVASLVAAIGPDPEAAKRGQLPPEARADAVAAATP